MSDLATLAIYWQRTRPYWKLLVGCGLGIAIGVACEFISPLVIAGMLDKLAADSSRPFSLFIGPILIVIALELVSLLTWRAGIWFLWRLEIRARQDIADQVFSHLAMQSEQFHSDNFGGALVADSTKFISGYDRLLDNLVFSFYTTFLSVVFIAIFLFSDLPNFVYALLIVTASYVFAAWKIKVKELPAHEQASASHSRQTSQLADTITNISTVRSFGAEPHEEDLFSARSANYAEDESRIMRQVLRHEYLTDGLPRLILLAAIVFAVLAVTKWGEEVGVILVVVSYTASLLGRLRNLQSSFKDINRALGDSREMTRILGLEPQIQDARHPDPLTISEGAIRFERVTFSYLPRHKLFEDLDLEIEPGQKVGLVGGSGSGKTTLTKLCLRFADIQGGRIMIDGQDISRVAQSELRRQITYVPQEPLLFHRSLADNIAYGRPDATEEEIYAAARTARAEEFILDLPDGYETLVGERGTKLSGGQRQRIALARAVLKNTPLLILDEATSALDSHSEALIQEALSELMEGRTAIVIAHRLSTIAGLDRILVLEHGQVVEDGDHEGLVALGGRYASLWAHQSGGFISE